MKFLICPFDKLLLSCQEKTATCPSGHNFDRAKEGYLNLLPVQAKQTKDPGDSPAMVQARRAFLATGFYDPIIDAIVARVLKQSPAAGTLALLDAGCGEGYYLNHLQNVLSTISLALCGLDISKHAVKAAAKTNRTIDWLVASNRQLPFADQSLDVVLCTFGFPVWPEFQRVLKSDGIVIMADPGPDHLLELRQLLYGTVTQKASDHAVPESFTLSAIETVRHIFHPSAHDLRHLIAMTPHQHRASAVAIDQAIATGCTGLTLDVALRILRLS